MYQKRSYLELKDKILNLANGLKGKVLKCMKDEIKYSDITNYLDHLSIFLIKADEEMEEVKALFRKPINEISEINMHFSVIKDLIYGNFDYYSILQFVDGIYNGIEDGNIKNTVDVDRFEDFMIHQAFGNIGDSIPSLVNMLEYPGPKEDSARDIESYKIISTWNNLFKFDESKKIYEACYSAITWTARNQINDSYTNRMLFCYAFNSIINYSVYTALVYALRIRGIYNYALQFVDEGIKTESVIQSKPRNSTGNKIFDDNVSEFIREPDLSGVSEFPSSDATNVFQITDELLIKDPAKLNELRSRFEKLVAITSGNKLANKIPSVRNNYSVETDGIRHNRFDKALKDNSLYILLLPNLSRNCNVTILNSSRLYNNKTNDTMITDAKLKLFDSLLNTKQGLGNVVSPKQEFLNAITHSEADYKNTADCRDHLLDLYVFFVYLSDSLNWTIKELNEEYNYNKYDEADSIMYKKYLAQIASILRAFYGEVMLAICHKAAFLERLLNALLKKTGDAIKEDLFTIRTPNDIINDIIASANDATTCAVPDTTRMTEEQRDEIDKDFFQYLEACDSYCMSLPEFQNIGYFTEAIDGKKISEIINRILAMIKNLFNKAKNLFNTNQFKAAQKWVKDRKNKLLAASFDKTPPDPSDVIEVLDYKATIGTGAAANLARFRNFINSIKIEEVTDLAKFKEDCYKSLLSDEYASFFINKNNDNEKAARLYKSKLLYNNSDANGVSKKVEINTNELLKRHMATWVSTVDEADKLSQQFAAAERTVNEITNSLKAKVVAYTNKPLEEKKPVENKNNEENTTTKAENTNDDQSKNIGNVGSIVSIYQEVLATAYAPLVHFTYEAVINQYSYIQQIFSKSSK